MVEAILFDLDDTLLVDEASNREAMVATGRFARERHGAEAGRFIRAAEWHATRLFEMGPGHEYCERVGISKHECLWGGGTGGEMAMLGGWAREFRLAVFEAALRDQMLDPAEGADEVAAFFFERRRRLQILMPDAVEMLRRLKPCHKLGLLTNGDSALQREKLAASGLEPLFDAVVVSGEHDTGKPDPRIFLTACDLLSVPAEGTAMIGNSLARDIAGARAAKLAAAVWLKIPGSEEFAPVEPDAVVTGLHQLPSLFPCGC